MKLTQEKIAKNAGVTQQFVSQCINGLARPRWATAKLMAAASGTTPDLWLDGTPEQIQAALNGDDTSAIDENLRN